MTEVSQTTALQDLCEQGQELLMQTRYLEAEETLASAEEQAWAARDWDTLSRLYMPLQEARRQRRQRCGEGIVRWDLIARSEADPIDAADIARSHSHGQLLVGGWGSIAPAVALRDLQKSNGLYLETFLAAVYPIGAGRAVIIVPLPAVHLPQPTPRSIDSLIRLTPLHSIVLAESELPLGAHPGDTATYAQVMNMWERLHTPFLLAGDHEKDPLRKMEAYRTAIRVDYACELAHQKLSDVARSLK